MYSRTTRQLTQTEVRALRRRMSVVSKQRIAEGKVALVVGPVIIGGLWLWTILADSDMPWLFPTIFWLAIGSLIMLLVACDIRRDATERILAFESAIEADVADDIRITSSDVLEFEELGDLGAYWAFQVEPETIVFVCGQAFYRSARFPNTDFSIVQIDDANGQLVELRIRKRGDRLGPKDVIPSSEWQTWRWPEHLEVLDGRLDEMRTLLDAPDKRG